MVTYILYKLIVTSTDKNPKEWSVIQKICIVTYLFIAMVADFELVAMVFFVLKAFRIIP